MIYYTFYKSPIGNLLLVANNDALTGIEFDISPKEDMEKKLPGATAGLPEALVKQGTGYTAQFLAPELETHNESSSFTHEKVT